MPKLYRPEEIIKVMESLGWVWVRTKGDHARLVQPGAGGRMTIPLRRRELNAVEFSLVLKQTE